MMGMPFTRRHFLAGAGIAGAGLLLPGCESSKSPALDDGGKPKRGGTIRVGTIETTRSGNLDAHAPLGSGIIRGWALYAKLWEWSPRCEPRLALAEEAEIAPDGLSWTIRLRKGLEFHHGKTIGADDVIFSIRRLSDPALASPYAALVAAVDRDSLQKLDERTVRLHAKDGQGLVSLADSWISFGGIVPTDYHPLHNVVGAGPFRLKSFQPGRLSAYTRFENYFKPGQPYADALEIIEFKDQTARLAALQAGQIDVADLVPPENSRLLAADPKVRVVVSPTNNVQSLDMNLLDPAFSDVRVRQAFRLLVDREDMVMRVLQGQGTIGNDLYSPHDPTYDHDIPQRGHDLDRARHLLRQAGKQDLTVKLTTSEVGASAALVFAQQAKQAGVTVHVEKLDMASFNGPLRNARTISTSGIPSRGFLASGLHYDAPTSTSNRSNFHDARFGALFNRALAQPDVSLRKPLVHAAQHIQHEIGGLLIWGFAHVAAASSRKIGGVRSEMTQFGGWRFDEFWRRDAA